MSVKRKVVITIEWFDTPKETEEKPPAVKSEGEKTQSTLDEVGIPKTPPMYQEGEYIRPPNAVGLTYGGGGGQIGMAKAHYGNGRKIHTCSRCGAPNRRMNHAKGGCLECL